MTRTLLVLLLLGQSIVTAHAGAAEPVAQEQANEWPPEPPARECAVSACGRYRLKLSHATQKPTTERSTVAEVVLNFALEVHNAEVKRFMAFWVADTYLEVVDPFVSVRTGAKFDITDPRHSGYTDNRPTSATVYLEIGEPREALAELTLALTFVRVKTWETRSFPDLKLGKSDYLHCGPFDLVVTGKENEANVCVAAFSEFRKEHKAYAERMPLRFLTHAFGIDHTEIHDAKGRRLNQDWVVTTGGASAGPFVLYAPGEPRPGLPKIERLPIEYPIAVKMQLPKEYDAERVNFVFEDLPLPKFTKNR